MFKTWSYFRNVCLCNSCARKIRNLGALFEFIRSAIGSESAVSQTPPKQSINLCKRLLQTLSGNSPCGKTVHVDSSASQVFEICRRIRTKIILKGTSGKNTVEFRFFEPPGEKEIGSNYRGVRKIGGKITIGLTGQGKSVLVRIIGSFEKPRVREIGILL